MCGLYHRWKTFNTKHVNKEWSSTFDEDGYGPMYEDDYKRLMESHGFRIISAKPFPISYKVTKVYMKNYIVQLPMALVGQEGLVKKYQELCSCFVKLGSQR